MVELCLVLGLHTAFSSGTPLWIPAALAIWHAINEVPETKRQTFRERQGSWSQGGSVNVHGLQKSSVGKSLARDVLANAKKAAVRMENSIVPVLV
jgi:hypothetical protein